jgi:hypothetical protein
MDLHLVLCNILFFHFFSLLCVKRDLPNKCISVCSYQPPVSKTLSKDQIFEAVGLCNFSKVLDKLRNEGVGQ